MSISASVKDPTPKKVVQICAERREATERSHQHREHQPQTSVAAVLVWSGAAQGSATESESLSASQCFLGSSFPGFSRGSHRILRALCKEAPLGLVHLPRGVKQPLEHITT